MTDSRTDAADRGNTGPTAQKRPGRTWMPIIVLLVFFGIGAFLAKGLTLNPREVPSPLVGKAVPEFDLKAVQGRQLPLSSKNLRGEVSMVNVFASWCVACRQEHPLLLALSKHKRVAIHGLNYKDEQTDAVRWLNRYGDPYTRTGADLDGKVGIEWGVYGVPETFVIDKSGNIAYKHIGPISSEDWEETISPLIEKLRKAG